MYLLMFFYRLILQNQVAMLLNTQEHLRTYGPQCEYFLLNMMASGFSLESMKTGIPFSIDFLKSICEKYKIILGLDCASSDIGEIISAIAPYALSLTGGEEEKVGVKSFDELDELLDELEVEE